MQLALGDAPRLDREDVGPDHLALQERIQIRHDYVCPVAPECLGLTGAVDADDPAEAARAPRFDAGLSILENSRLTGLRTDRARPRQEGVGSGLAGQVLSL